MNILQCLDDEKEEETKPNENENSQYDLVKSPERVGSFESFFDHGNDDAAVTMVRHMLHAQSNVNH